MFRTWKLRLFGSAGLLLLLLLPLSVLAAQDVPAAEPPPPVPEATPLPRSEPSPEPSRPLITYEDGQTTFEFEQGSLAISNRAQFRFTEELPDDELRLPGTSAEGD